MPYAGNTDEPDRTDQLSVMETSDSDHSVISARAGGTSCLIFPPTETQIQAWKFL